MCFWCFWPIKHKAISITPKDYGYCYYYGYKHSFLCGHEFISGAGVDQRAEDKGPD